MNNLNFIFGIFFYFVVCLLSGCCAIAPKGVQGLDSCIRQAIEVHPIKKDSAQAWASAWQKQGNDWRRVYFVSAVIGRNGMASPGDKREGDGMTPSGIYPLGPAFGYAPSVVTGLEYHQAGNLDFWVDDVHSMQYNQWVRAWPSARSFERLKRFDNLYQYGIVVQYNMHPVIPGAGSAIFMHVWRKYNSPTSGCVAFNQRNLRKILHWLNRQYQPVIILEKD